MLYDLLSYKAIGLNSIRCSYASYLLPKLNTNQVQRIAFFMRTSPALFIAPNLPFQGDQAVDAHAARAPAPPTQGGGSGLS